MKRNFYLVKCNRERRDYYCASGEILNIKLVKRIREESPSVWSLPFTILLIVLIIAATDVLFPFLPIRIGQIGWMWILSTLVTSIVSSLVTERLSMDQKKAFVSMVLAGAFSILFYRDFSAFLLRTPIQSLNSSISNTFVGLATFTTILTMVPGIIVGGFMGGIISIIPLENLCEKKSHFQLNPSVFEDKIQGFGVMCVSCGRYLPTDSKFCSFCGEGLTHQPIPYVSYCRLCGSDIKYGGSFCPECGQEIELLLKPHIFYSE